MEWYPSGSRGSPAKGVGWIKLARGFKSLPLRQERQSLNTRQQIAYIFVDGVVGFVAQREPMPSIITHDVRGCGGRFAKGL